MQSHTAQGRAQTRAAVFERENVGSAIWALALPTIVSQLIGTIYNLADTFWVGRLGDADQLAALALVFPLSVFVTALANLFGIGAGTSIAASLGAQDRTRALQSASFALSFGAAAAVVLAVAVHALRVPLLALLGATPSIAPYTSVYIDYVFVVGALPSVINMIIANMLRGEGDSMAASIGLSCGGVLNIILDPFFVLPIGLGLQIRGAAAATLISNLFTTAFFLVVLLRKRGSTVIRPDAHPIAAARAVGANVILTGAPSCAQTLLNAVSNLVINTLMIGYGSAAEAAIGVVKKIDSIPFCVVTGLAQGAAPLIAYSYAAGRKDRTRRTHRLMLAYCLALSLLMLSAIELFAPAIAGAFITDSDTAACCAVFLREHCMSLPFAAVTFVTVAYFQSVGARGSAFGLSLIRKGILDVPLMFLMNVLIPMYGIVACQPIMDGISCVCALLLFTVYGRTRLNNVK